MDRFLRPCLAEMIGTFFLCFIVAGAICSDALMPGTLGIIGVALAYGLILSLAVTATVNASGGHLNPAITITQWVLGKIDTPQMIYYVVAQLLGALIAGMFLTLMFASSADVMAAGLGTPHLSDKIGIGGFNRFLMATVIEMVFTFVMVFIFFATVVDPRGHKVAGFGVGLAAAAAYLVAGSLTGAALNPARYFGVAFWEAGVKADFSKLGDFPVYITGPILGALGAGWIYSNYLMTPPKTSS